MCWDVTETNTSRFDHFGFSCKRNSRVGSMQFGVSGQNLILSGLGSVLRCYVPQFQQPQSLAEGKLTAGFGVKEDRIGPELGFGWVIGDAYEKPVLLIKLAWGGKSLAKDFRPPSSGGEVGPYYKEIVERTKAVLRNLKNEFSEFGDRDYELAGFGWHQGWNDRINQAFNDEYEKNLANFIRDIRKDLGVEKLPFVIAETGMTGPGEKHPRALSLMKAQAAVAEYEEFRGNVAFVGTKALWRAEVQSPTKQGYHWNTNAETYYLIGEAMGTAMKRLCENQAAK